METLSGKRFVKSLWQVHLCLMCQVLRIVRCLAVLSSRLSWLMLRKRWLRFQAYKRLCWYYRGRFPAVYS